MKKESIFSDSTLFECCNGCLLGIKFEYKGGLYIICNKDKNNKTKHYPSDNCNSYIGKSEKL